MIHKSLLCCLALFVAAAMNVSSADASMLSVGDVIKFTNGSGNDAGEFGVTLGGSFLYNTFCVETNEFVSFGTEYTVDSLQDDIVNGGNSGGSPDPLSGETKWLFYNMHNLQLAGYDGSAAEADKLQNAFWELEGENNDGSGAGYIGLATAAIGVGNWFQAQSSVTGLNISRTSDGVIAQSMLYIVPEPGSIAIWGLLGLAGCVVLRRKNAKSKLTA